MEKNSAFGITSLVIISTLNSFFTIPFFLSMLIEQIRLGTGTNLEMGAIVVWFFEAALLIPFTLCIVFTILSIEKKDDQSIIVVNLVQIVLYIVLNILSNAWIIF